MAVETCTFICYSTVLDTFWPRLPCNDCAAGEVLEFEDTDLDGGLAGEIRLTLNGIAGEYAVTWGTETFTFSGAATVPPTPATRVISTLRIIEGGRVYQALRLDSKSVLDVLCRVKSVLDALSSV